MSNVNLENLSRVAKRAEALGKDGLVRGRRAVHAFRVDPNERKLDLSWLDPSWSDEKFVETVYQRVLGRKVDDEGRKTYLGLLQRGRSRESVAKRIAKSSEARSLPSWWDPATDDAAFLELLYRKVLDRAPDVVGINDNTAFLAEGGNRRDLMAAMESSPEKKGGKLPQQASESFHGGRVAWMRSLPPAKRILDLGGTALNDRRGAMLFMGYPFPFEELVIIELPADDRHNLYRIPGYDDLETPQGPVRYLYRSMCDLDDIEEGSYDMVVSGQSIEHITPEEGKKLVEDVARILAPGGYFAVDTPNGVVSKIYADEIGEEFINPDHKIEYTHDQLRDLLEDAGLEIERAYGIGYMPETTRTGKWDFQEQVDLPGLYREIDQSYTQAYLARKPARVKAG